MHLIFELFGWLIIGFIGALVGVMWPPKSLAWRRWRNVGIAFGAAAIATFLLAVGLFYFGATAALSWGLFALAFVLVLAYMIVGNVCRMFHESR